MKKPQLLILMFFTVLIAVFMYADNPHYYQNRLYRKMRKYSKQFGKPFDFCQGVLSNSLEMIQDKLPF